MENKLIRIVLVDDHKVVRDSWRQLLENHPRFSIIADYENGNDAIENGKLLLPDIMIIDINMVPINGLDVVRNLSQSCPSIKTIGLSVNNLPHYAEKMIDLGGRGYFTKTSSLEEICHGIIEIYNGNTYICDEIRKQMKG